MGGFKRIILAATAVLIVASACFAAVSGVRLLVNGKVASHDVRVIKGVAYVPVNDVAKALNMVVVKRNGGYEMTPPGGADQIQGSNRGGIGDEILAGNWRFQVLSVKEANSYSERYYQEKRTISPKGRHDTLILVECRLKNAMKKSQSAFLTERQPGNTALADDEGNSYAPLDYDARQAEDKTQSYESAMLLPGAKTDFVLVFSVPDGTVPKDLVFTLRSYSGNSNMTKDVRVSLTKKK